MASFTACACLAQRRGGTGGTGGTDSQTLSLSGNILSISNGNSVDLTPILGGTETLTILGTPTWDSVTGLFSIDYTDENGVTTTRTCTINPVFVNTDNQTLVGDTTGTVNLTLTPVVDPNTGATNYTVKADLPKATSTPSISTLGGTMTTTNALTYDAARGGWYVIDRTATVQTYNANPVANLTMYVDIVTSSANTIDYFVSASLPRATSVPSGSTNKLTYNASLGGWYVDVVSTTQRSDAFTATANQTAFTLSATPVGSVYGYRNGVKLATAFTVSGTSVTYVPANNDGKTIDAGDIISFEYEA